MNPWVFLAEFKGELAALSAAFFWALASAIYGQVGSKIPPMVLNLIKGVVAIALLLLTISLRGQPLPEMSQSALGILLLSGVIGLGIGDTAFFAALNDLGARKAILMETLAPTLAAILAFIFLDEQISLTAFLGIFLILFGVAWVVTERVKNGNSDRPHQIRGILWALVAEISQATGATLSRAALTQSTISPMWSTLVRLMGGTLVLLLWLSVARPESPTWWQQKRSPRVLAAIFLAIFFGTYLGIWLQQTAFKFTPVGIAQALNATSPLFILPIAVFMGDKLSLRAVLGAVIALVGIALLFGLH